MSVGEGPLQFGDFPSLFKNAIDHRSIRMILSPMERKENTLLESRRRVERTLRLPFHEPLGVATGFVPSDLES